MQLSMFRIVTMSFDVMTRFFTLFFNFDKISLRLNIHLLKFSVFLPKIDFNTFFINQKTSHSSRWETSPRFTKFFFRANILCNYDFKSSPLLHKFVFFFSSFAMKKNFICFKVCFYSPKLPGESVNTFNCYFTPSVHGFCSLSSILTCMLMLS